MDRNHHFKAFTVKTLWLARFQRALPPYDVLQSFRLALLSVPLWSSWLTCDTWCQCTGLVRSTAQYETSLNFFLHWPNLHKGAPGAFVAAGYNQMAVALVTCCPLYFGSYLNYKLPLLNLVKNTAVVDWVHAPKDTHFRHRVFPRSTPCESTAAPILRWLYTDEKHNSEYNLPFLPLNPTHWTFFLRNTKSLQQKPPLLSAAVVAWTALSRCKNEGSTCRMKWEHLLCDLENACALSPWQTTRWKLV